MPLPLIPIAVAIVVAAIGAGGVQLYRNAQGKKLAVLGTRESGKTTLINFLRTGEIPEGYRPTMANEPFSENVSFRDLSLKLSGEDLSGDKSRWKEWRSQAEDADLVCFLAAWNQLESDEIRPKIERAADQVGSWNIDPPIMLVITHLDMAPGCDGDFVRGAPSVKHLRSLLQAREVHAVDLTNQEDCERIGYHTLEILK